MANLKDKLAQKVEYIDGESNELPKDIILLNKPENTAPISIIPEFAATISEAKERAAMLQKFVKEIMIPEVDYGQIPGCQKPSLYKPGAEKLCDIFGFSKQLEVTSRTEDWEKGFFSYEVKITLVNKRTGLIEAEGIGSCNSRERKYKSQDSFTINNTILKMAKKRALIDAVLSATRSSGIFTQDIEDIEPENKCPSRKEDAPSINDLYDISKKLTIPANYIK
jgi:hypothetical protein